jgi:DNA adenine methylase
VRYLGGKAKIADELASFLEAQRGGRLYIEPFIGSAAVFSLMRGPKEGYDIHADLIEMWKAVRDGWEPPRDVSEQEWESAKTMEVSPLRGFIGFGCSFGGIFFGNYARGGGRNYADESSRAIIATARMMSSDDVIERRSFFALQADGALIYCDPPYEQTAKYESPFPTSLFWTKVRELSKTNRVFVTEYSAPDDFQVLRGWIRRSTLSLNKTSVKYERLFRLREEVWA